MQIRITEVPVHVLNYLVSVYLKHEPRCSWMLEKDGYKAWQSYEQAWGNPIPNYCEDWSVGGPVMESEKIVPHFSNYGCAAYYFNKGYAYSGGNALIAVTLINKQLTNIEIPVAAG